jgi:acetyl-CoA C-acetyltransferase
MTEAYIVIGKPGKGALSSQHPQHPAVTVLKALQQRNSIDTSEVDDVVWGTSAQKGKQGGDMGLLRASGDYARRHGLKTRVRVVATANVGDCPTLMLNAPVPAVRKVLARAGLTPDDIDLWEVNEAFAVVVEKFIRDLRLDREKVNVNGGAIALGHPIGATGAVLIGTVLDELERRDLKRALVTMCAAGGMAPAIIIERV